VRADSLDQKLSGVFDEFVREKLTHKCDGRDGFFKAANDFVSDTKAIERVLLVIGEPGVGKSTARAHVIDRARKIFADRSALSAETASVASASAGSDVKADVKAETPAKVATIATVSPASTSAAAALLESRVVAWHVCRWNRSETLSPKRFVLSIASQLCRSVDGFAKAFRNAGGRAAIDKLGTADALIAGVLRPLQSVSRGSSRCLVIDSLDEAVIGAADGAETIADVLATEHVVAALSESSIRIVTTTRPEAPVLQRLHRLPRRELKFDDESNKSPHTLPTAFAAPPVWPPPTDSLRSESRHWRRATFWWRLSC
jgi:hypothetical protein